MSSSNKRKVSAAKQETNSESVHYTPWDIVNVFGFALGLDKNVLEYAARNESSYNYAYCSSRNTLKLLRSSCILRQAIIKHYGEMVCLAQEKGKVVLPQAVLPKTNRAFRDRVAKCESPSEVFWLAQKRVERMLSKFQTELPPWFHAGEIISEQFKVPATCKEDLEGWCGRVTQELGNQPYMRDYDSLSSRVLRDDRDLLDELFELKGLSTKTIAFPYDKCKSNRQTHLERLQEFCQANKPITVEIDTENVESSMVIAFLRRLEDVAGEAIGQVNVYLTGMEGKPWRHLSEFISSKVEYQEVTRIRAQKSVLDTAIIASVMRSKYSGTTGGSIIVSSDCDFLVLHEQLPDYPVCYCCCRAQTASATLRYLRGHDLPSVYIDYIVNNHMSRQAGQDCMMVHIINAISASVPNLRDIAKQAASEVCTQSGYTQYIGVLDSLFGAMQLGVNMDGTVSATIKNESVGNK